MLLLHTVRKYVKDSSVQLLTTSRILMSWIVSMHQNYWYSVLCSLSFSVFWGLLVLRISRHCLPCLYFMCKSIEICGTGFSNFKINTKQINVNKKKMVLYFVWQKYVRRYIKVHKVYLGVFCTSQITIFSVWLDHGHLAYSKRPSDALHMAFFLWDT